MNYIFLMGNVTRDPVMTQFQKESEAISVAKYDLAVNRRYGKAKEKEVDFFHCTSFGKQAEFVNKYFKKGDRMVLVGQIHNNNYTNQNGEMVYSYQVIPEKIFFGNSAPKEEASDPNDFMDIPDELAKNLPFN